MSLLMFLIVTCVLPICLSRWSGYCANVAFGWDLLLSNMTGGLPGESISGRTGSSYVEGKWKGKVFVPVVDFLMRKKGHCVLAIEGDKLRAQAILADYGKLEGK